MSCPTQLIYARRALECSSCSGARVIPEVTTTRELAAILADFEQRHRHCTGWDTRPADPPVDDRPDLEAQLAAAGILAEAVRRLERLRRPATARETRTDHYRDMTALLVHAQANITKALADWDRLPRAGRLTQLATAGSLLERCAHRAVRDAVIFAAAFCSERHLDLEHQGRLATLLSALLVDVRYDGQEAAVRARVKAIFERAAADAVVAFPYVPPDRGFVLDLVPGDWLVTVPGGDGGVDRVLARCRSDEELEAYLARAALPAAVVVLVAHATTRP